MLRNNQINAINISKNNDFKSGIHYHATGTGKSWIAMYILKEFNEKYKNKNILWLCERKTILEQQFDKNILKERNFKNILDNFIVLNFVNNKNENWYESLNSCKFWKKPYLCIINRSFLITKKKYENIKNNIDLVIHDECHSIENKTTKIFYDWLIKKNPKISIIGFSATPEFIYPLNNVLSKYSIYDAFKDKVILKPKILWLKSENKLKKKDLLEILDNEISKLHYKKIIVWCGIIKECIKVAKYWRKYFIDYDICIDFNNINNNNNDFYDFEHFMKKQRNSILFCAVKHREGSDIPNIDCCIFMDMVQKRSERVFVQSMGRVLRKDKENNKKYGLVIDLNATSTIDICNRVQYYLKLDEIFPWKYNIKKKIINGNVYFINKLVMTKEINKITIIENNKIYKKEEIKKYFIREIPKKLKYEERLNIELDLIIEKNLFGNILRAIEILKLTKNIPHITRGSCGSSLVCYLLGISHIDPIENKISFSRFLNQYRDNLPDIDFDFPHFLRDEVFLRLFQKWGNKVARISNHNFYHEKSALRKSLRMNGINKFISKYDLNKEINKLDHVLKNKILKQTKNLEGTFKGFSLHCGGIIYYPEGIPKDNIINNSERCIIKQVKLNKIDVADNKNFKIDILSSKGLSQLYYCNNFNKINFNMNIGDKKTIDLLSRGDNIGITLGETPLMRRAFLLIKPKTIMDVAVCLSIIRPAAKKAKKQFELGEFRNENIIFDDDAIFIIKKLLNCEEDYADFIRRKYNKDNNILKDVNKKNKKKLISILSDLQKYGFCKAHAISYAQLIWQLAYNKANNPKKFWKSTLKNIDSNYRNWVHLYEANLHNVTKNVKNKSIYSHSRDIKMLDTDLLNQLKIYGFWKFNNYDFYPNCFITINNNKIYFKGLIAYSRILSKKKLSLFIGVKKNKYIDILIEGNIYYTKKYVIVSGEGIIKNFIYNIVECKSKDIKFI